MLLEGACLFVVGMAINMPVIALGKALVGFGLGLGTLTVALWLSSITPQKYLGRIMGGQTVAVYFGVFVSSFMGAELLARTSSYQGLFLTNGVMGIAVGVVYWIGAMAGKRAKTETV